MQLEKMFGHCQTRRLVQKLRSPKLFSFSRTEAHHITETDLGDIVAVAGVEGITSARRLPMALSPAPLPHIAIDSPPDDCDGIHHQHFSLLRTDGSM